MGEISEFSGVPIANIAEVNGVPAANIGSINGVEWPSGAALLPTWSYGESRYFVSAGPTITPRWSYGESEVIHDGT